MAYCTVVVPCYNEARRLRVDAFERFLTNERNQDIALLFVNDGSKDETLSILQDLCSRLPGRAFVHDQQPNRGKAEAVRSGMLHVIASGEAQITGFWDADLATPLAQIHDMLDLMTADSHLNLVFGARVRLLGRAIHRQPLRHYLGRCFATAVSVLLKVPIYDTQCGAKLFRVTDDLALVLSKPFLSRWIFDVEILARFLATHGNDPQSLETEICEYPLPEWTDVAGSKVGSLDFFKAAGELATIYRRTLHDSAFTPGARQQTQSENSSERASSDSSSNTETEVERPHRRSA
jgi:dolichyl-phosphate beta-glucosyltransferase